MLAARAQPDPRLPQLRRRTGEMLEELARELAGRLRLLGARVHRAETAAAAANIAAGIGTAAQSRLAFLDNGSAVLEIDAPEVLAEHGIAGITREISPAERRELALSGIRLASCRAASAESGRLAMEACGTGVPAAVTVVILPIDRICATDAELQAVLTALPAGSTEEYVDARAPERLHVILPDNGRLHMALDGDFAAALRCIGCRACADVCEPLAAVQGPTPIGLIQAAWQRGLRAAAAQEACLSCGDCERVCPVDIPIPGMVLELRRRLQASRRRARPARLGIGVLDRIAARRSHRPPPARTLAMMLIERGDAAPAAAAMRDRLSPREREGAVLRDRSARPGPPSGMRVALVPGCVVDEIAPESGFAALELLQAAGCECVTPPRQRCCGLAQILRGEEAAAAELARETVAALAGARVDAYVFGSPACAAAVRLHYVRLLQGTAGAAGARLIAARAATPAEIFARLTPPGPARPIDAEGIRTALHAACGPAWNADSAGSGPLAALAAAGIPTLAGMPDGCCGCDPASQAPNAARLGPAEELLRRTIAGGAQALIAEDPGCLVWLQRVAERLQLPLRLLDLSVVLRQATRSAGG